MDGNPYTIIGFGNGPKRLATRGPIDDTALEDKNYLQEAVIPMDPASDSKPTAAPMCSWAPSA